MCLTTILNWRKEMNEQKEYITKLEKENKRLRQALEFYTNKENYQLNSFGNGYLTPYVLADGGHKARKALEGDSNA